MKQALILGLIISGIALAIIYETNKSVERLTKAVLSTNKMQTKN